MEAAESLQSLHGIDHAIVMCCLRKTQQEIGGHCAGQRFRHAILP
jgi:hypothetical protein